MIHLERQKSRAFARIYFYEDSFCFQFLPRQFELFELSKEEQIRIINNNFSSYECNKYLELFDKFKKMKKFKFDKVDNIILNNRNVGHIVQREFLGSFVYLKIKKSNFKQLEALKKKFSSMNEAKDYVSKNYALLQVKYSLYLQNDCI